MLQIISQITGVVDDSMAKTLAASAEAAKQFEVTADTELRSKVVSAVHKLQTGLLERETEVRYLHNCLVCIVAPIVECKVTWLHRHFCHIFCYMYFSMWLHVGRRASAFRKHQGCVQDCWLALLACLLNTNTRAASVQCPRKPILCMFCTATVPAAAAACLLLELVHHCLAALVLLVRHQPRLLHSHASRCV
jgi:hypothetical protein